MLSFEHTCFEYDLYISVSAHVLVNQQTAVIQYVFILHEVRGHLS